MHNTEPQHEVLRNFSKKIWKLICEMKDASGEQNY